jgi:hypothetical protein
MNPFRPATDRSPAPADRTPAAAGAGVACSVVLPRRNPASPPRPQPAAAASDPVALTLGQLRALLDRQGSARRVLRALALLEQGLARHGWQVLEQMPLPALRRALEQLEGLVSNWAPAGLSALRSKLAVALIERDEVVMALPPTTTAPPS